MRVRKVLFVYAFEEKTDTKYNSGVGSVDGNLPWPCTMESLRKAEEIIKAKSEGKYSKVFITNLVWMED